MGIEPVVSHNKKETRESFLEDIEEAYLELIKAYAACLAYIIIEKSYLLHFMVPLIIIRSIQKRMNRLRATFLFIIATEKKEVEGSNYIQKFKLYSEDMNVLREQMIKSESSYIISRSTPAIVSLLLIFLRYTVGLPAGKFYEIAVLFIDLILLFVLLVLLIEIVLTTLLIVPSLLESRNVLNRFGINEKEIQFYKLSQNYFQLISGSE